MRSEDKIHFEVSISYYPENNEIQIYTDEGRVLRPLIVVENGKSKLTEEIERKLKDKEISWSDLIKQGIIEYIDAEEDYVDITML